MIAETQQLEYPYSVKIETSTGQSATVPIAFLTPKQVEDFLQFDFKRLAEEAGIKGARIQVERAMTADYDKVMREVATCLRSAMAHAAYAVMNRELGSLHSGFRQTAQVLRKEPVSP